MALRVLLADESSTIKKVFQLALQDFAVDVRPVNVGTDVALVARDFKPDLIFADVLLQKRSGYEVAAELKASPDLGDIPVVLMYSGFMDLDEDKYQASHANAQLEKPFEVAALRKLVTDLVPRTQNQRLSQFLTFPKMPEMQEKPAPPAPAAPPAAPVDEFEQVSIPKMRGQPEKYRVELKPEDMDASNVPVELSVGDDDVDVGALLEPADPADGDNFTFGENTNVASPSARPNARPRGEIELEPFADDAEFRALAHPPLATPAAPLAPTPPAPAAYAAPAPAPRPAPEPHPAAVPAPVVPALDMTTIERIVRAQSAELIESAVWKIVPELAAQIIERELNKLLREREAHPR